MKSLILAIAGATNTNHQELISFFVASYGVAWKEELSAMAEIVQPGDRLVIDPVTSHIYAATISIEGDINVRH